MTEMSDAEVFGAPKEMSDEDVFGRAAIPAGPEPIPQASDQAPPAAFMDRVDQGQKLTKAIGASDQRGVIDKLLGLTGERYQLWPEKVIRSGFTLAHDVMTGELPTQVVDPVSGEVMLNPEMIARSMDMASFQLGQTHISPTVPRPLLTHGEQFVRPGVDETGAMVGSRVGGLPAPDDFSNAGKVMDSPHAEPNLRRMWQEDGIHPAEAVHDAANDAFLKNEITAPSITAYHGTPHDFERFDISKIGTGEGRQTEGHGFYFGTNPDVAQWYAKKNAGQRLGLQFDALTPEENAALPRTFDTRFFNDSMNQDTVKDILANTREQFANELVRADVEDPAKWKRGIELIDKIQKSGNFGITEPKGNIYQAKINASDNEFVDLRKPLSEQPKAAQPILKDVGDDLEAALSENPELAKQLKDAGIAGVRYGSEADNLVVFDPDRIEITHKNGQPVSVPPKEWNVPPEETDFVFGKGSSLSAAQTDPDVLAASLREQPPQPAGSLMASIKQAGETLFDIGRDAQMLVAPMARGTRDSMAMVKDFANSLRRNRWNWARIDADIAKRFDPESRARMWTAADEESVSLQLGEPAHMREHQGLATLEPAERALVEDMQARAQNAWVRARDAGMVEGEGLPAYTPRMVINTASASSKDGALPLNVIGSNLKTRTGNLLKRKYLEAQETEAAAKAKYGDEAMLARDIRVLPLATSHLEDAVAGRTLINQIKAYGEGAGTETVVEGGIPSDAVAKYFTLDHPAFKTWRPKFKAKEGGGVEAVKDAEGNTIFEQVPIYVHSDFEGPLRAVLQHKSGPLYQGLMALKGKTMSLIMNSPMIHNAVEWGRALPAMPGKVASFKVYFEGNRAKNNVPLMQEAIDNGLVPIGHRFFNQDITSIMEAPDLTPGRSWTAKLLAAVPGLFDEAAGTAVKRAIDKAGDFWHNTLLWDRVGDLQMGLYKNFLDDAVAKGIDRTTASRMAAHWANRYAGSLPKEAMSDGATKVANLLMFSRSFTMGNLGVLKDVFTGLPKDVLAQIERDAGFGEGAIEGADAEAPAQAVAYAKSMARRKAMAVVAMDMGLFYVGNSILQSALNVMFNDSSLDKELHGYAGRLINKLQEVREHPLQLVQPLRLLEDISSTSENEPGRQDRLRVGYAKDGTAIYARNPAGKIGEEFLGYMTGPLDMMRKKLGTIARPVWQIMSNDAGFGRKIYDPNADTPAKYLANLGRIAAHIAGSQFPVGQLGAFHDLVTEQGDTKVNMAQAFGPFIGITFSKGAPGGPAVGEMYSARTQHDFAVQNAMPDIRRQIQRGDVIGAIGRMTELGIPAGLQRFYVRTTLNPATRLSARAVRDFYLYATPEQRARFERAQQAPALP